MEREEVISLMTQTVIDWNKNMSGEQNLPAETIENWIATAKPQFDYVNSMLYDALVSNGIIK